MERLKKLIDRISGKNRMNDIKYVTKLYKRSQLEVLALFLLIVAIVGGNYSYLVFKLKMTTDHIYTQKANEIAQKHLDEPAGFGNFDLMTIGLYSEQLQKEDKYFKLYKFGEYDDELKEMDEIGAMSDAYETETGAGFVAFRLFTPSAVKSVKKHIKELEKYDTLIIDLRDNTGGMLTSAEQMAEIFLDRDMTVYTKETRGKSVTVKTKKAASLKPQKIIILQNEWTASAAELFIMALKENLDNVTTVGVKSYGKGLGQNEYRLTGGYAFKLTAMRLLTPSGSCVDGKGIEPDIEYTKDDIISFADSL